MHDGAWKDPDNLRRADRGTAIDVHASAHANSKLGVGTSLPVKSSPGHKTFTTANSGRLQRSTTIGSASVAARICRAATMTSSSSIWHDQPTFLEISCQCTRLPPRRGRIGDASGKL